MQNTSERKKHRKSFHVRQTSLTVLCTVLALLLTLFLVVKPLPFIAVERENRPFGFCDLSLFPKETTPMCAPCPIRQTPVVLDQSYAKPYWGAVHFPPVSRFVINTHDPVRQDVFISGSVHAQKTPWDVFIWDLIVRVSTEPGLVVDVGANIGYFSLLAASLGHTVVAFEPMNRNVAKFWSSIERNGFTDRISLFQNAVASERGHRVSLESTHYTNQGNGKINWRGNAQEAVDTVALDDLVHSDVLLLKIDVEGFESGVLDGARQLLCAHIVKYITIEFSPETRNNPVCSSHRMLATLKDLGYTVSDVVENAAPLDLQHMETFPPNILFTRTGQHRTSRACGSSSMPVLRQPSSIESTDEMKHN